jgi:hypothetical protein
MKRIALILVALTLAVSIGGFSWGYGEDAPAPAVVAS